MREQYSIKEALESTETKMTVLHAILRNQYGEEFYAWDPSTIALEVRDDFQADMSAETVNRTAALQVVMTNNAFFQRMDAFMGICNTLGSGAPFFSVFDPVTVEEAAWTLAEVALNREMLPFSPTIKKFVEAVLTEEGYGAGDHPEFFDPVFEDTLESRKAVSEARANPNSDSINQLINEELRDMIYQFNKIPSIEGVDGLLLAGDDRTLVESLI